MSFSNLSAEEIKALEAPDDEGEIRRVFGYSLAYCPDSLRRCRHDAEWGHPCDRDESGRYECERLLA